MTDGPMRGAVLLDGGLTLPDLWTGLHANAVAWHRAGLAAYSARQGIRINESDRAVLSALAVLPSDTWATFA